MSYEASCWLREAFTEAKSEEMHTVTGPALNLLLSCFVLSSSGAADRGFRNKIRLADVMVPYLVNISPLFSSLICYNTTKCFKNKCDTGRERINFAPTESNANRTSNVLARCNSLKLLRLMIHRSIHVMLIVFFVSSQDFKYCPIG